jgi:hypothetical protein
MKKNILAITFTACVTILLLLPSGMKAQDKSYWELNLNGGTSLFFGDIKQYQWVPVSNNENEWRFGAGLQFGRQLSYVFGVRGQALYGQLAGTKREWKRYFQSDYIETNVNFTINFNNIFGQKRSDRFLNLYMITGVGLTQYNTTVYELGTNKIVAQVGNGHGKGIGGRTLEGILTVGMGADFRINDNLHVTLESANRGMNSDAYDHWEKGFPFDVYNYTSLGLSWRFGVGKSKAPPYHNSGDETNYYDYGTDTTTQVEEVITPEPVQPGQQVEVLEIEEQKPVEPPVVVPATTTTVQQPEAPARPNPEYRVQIKAKYGKPLSREKLSAQYNIPVNEIQEDRHNGYYIYTVGSYATYNEARDRRNVIRNINGIYDAFVVAFNECGRLDKLP